MVQNSAGVKYDNPIEENMSPKSKSKYHGIREMQFYSQKCQINM